MKSIVLFIILSIISISVPREKYTYQEKPQLTWDDFMGTPPRGTHHAASVNSGIAFSYEAQITDRTIKIEYEVHSEFYPQLSWKKDLDEDDAQLLRHEQQHWNITELYARKLRKALDTYKPRKGYKRDINNIFKAIERQRQETQARYDYETNHGLLLTQQRDWETYIAQEMFVNPG